MDQIVEFGFEWAENIVGDGENILGFAVNFQG